jgi:rubrerythrin
LYPAYAGEAHRAGDEDAAERFIELGGDERRHAELIRDALRELDARRVSIA